jgi:hypothetical protein
MRPLEWKRAVVEMARVLEDMASLDTDRLWEYHLPGVAATAAQIAKVERHLGEPLDPSHRALLEVAGGWPCMFQNVDVFGPQDLLGGPRMRVAYELLSYLEDVVLEQSGYGRDQLLPIACSSVDIDLFVIARRNAPQPGTVVWFSGREIDRYPNVDQYFLAMLEYNRRQVAYFRTGEWPQ